MLFCIQSFPVSNYVRFCVCYFFPSGSSLKNFLEPLSGCTGNMSGGQSSHAKERERSPLVTAGIGAKRPQSSCPAKPGERRAQQKELQEMREGDMDKSDRAIHLTKARTPQSSNEGIGKQKESTGPPNRTPAGGKRKMKSYRQMDNEVNGGAEELPSDSEDIDDAAAHPPEAADGEEVRAFAGHVQTLCTQMLNSPLCKKAQGVQRRAHGHDSQQRAEHIPSRNSEDIAQPKRSKVSASAEVLKERFEPRQMRNRQGVSPEEKTTANKSAGASSKKTKKKKV